MIEAALHSAAGHDELACARWREAEIQFETCSLEGHLAAARARRGACISGPEGAQLLARANDYFAAQAIADPVRYVAMLAPARAR